MIEPKKKEYAQEILEEFLTVPLDDGLPILERFATLPGAVFSKGEKRVERFVYIPGTVKRPVLLVAHVDTVWDRNYPWTTAGEGFVLQGDRVISASSKAGIGADDRAGCALLWLLRDCGHSLLLLDGEEQGALGARHLRRKHPDLYRALNRHAYMLELDLSGEGLCHYCDLPNSRSFRKYIESSFHCSPDPRNVRTDIACLCRSVCGANLSIGGEDEHSPKESLDISKWMATYETLCTVLSRRQRYFPSSLAIRIYRFAGRQYGKCFRRNKNRGK